jgi:3'-5' exoribonuclease
MRNLFEMDEVGKVGQVVNKEKIKCYVKIDQLSIQKTVNQTEYFNLSLIDETGMIHAKKWNVTDEDKQNFKQGQVVFIHGVGSEYNGRVQLIVEQMRVVDETDQVDLSVFFTKAPISIDSLKEGIEAYLAEIKNETLHVITKTLLTKYESAYYVFPAATKNHHAYLSGLAHHVLTMLNHAKSFISIYPEINPDLLYAGIILHDLGKVIELSDHLAPEYTTVGKLIGHINLCFEEIRLVAHTYDLKGEEVMYLQHLVLSHHGLLEYGSPKTPALLEAEVLHLIDLIDSRINMIVAELNQVNEGEFTKRSYSLDNRSFYKHELN